MTEPNGTSTTAWHYADPSEQYAELTATIASLRAKIEQAKATLSDYADEDNWTIQSDDGSESDLWHGFGSGPSAARKTLEELNR